MQKKLKIIGLYLGGLAVGLFLLFVVKAANDDILHEKSHEEMDRMKYGVINKRGEWVSKPGLMEYPKIENKFGLNDFAEYESPENEKLKGMGIEAYPFHDGLAIAKFGDSFGVVNEEGKMIVKPIFKYTDRLNRNREENLILRFSEGLALVKIDGKFGYMNTKGEIAIKPQFDDAESFRDGLAHVRSFLKGGYIDKTGQFKLESNHAGDYDFSEGFAGFYDGKKCGYQDKKGKIVIAPQFDMVGEFKNGKALVGVVD